MIFVDCFTKRVMTNLKLFLPQLNPRTLEMRILKEKVPNRVKLMMKLQKKKRAQKMIKSEQARKKVKDAQLGHYQIRIKELEAKLLEGGGLGATSTLKTPPVGPAQKPGVPLQRPGAPVQRPGVPAQKPGVPKPGVPAQKPGVPAPLVQTQTPVNKPQQPAAQNKVPNRPNLPTRGGGPGRVLGGRGGAPTNAATHQGTGGGVSIMGAAKRPREEGEGETQTIDNSLAKRLKPAEDKPSPPAGRRPAPKQ